LRRRRLGKRVPLAESEQNGEKRDYTYVIHS